MQQSSTSDSEILDLIAQENNLAFEYLYDKYAAMMYGAILRVTSNKKVAEKILIQSFAGLKKNKTLFESKKALCIILLHYTHATALEILAKKEIILKRKDKTAETFPILSSLIFQPLSLKDVAAMHMLTEEESKRMLRLEVNQLRVSIRQQQSQHKQRLL